MKGLHQNNNNNIYIYILLYIKYIFSFITFNCIVKLNKIVLDNDINIKRLYNELLQYIYTLNYPL